MAPRHVPRHGKGSTPFSLYTPTEDTAKTDDPITSETVAVKEKKEAPKRGGLYGFIRTFCEAVLIVLLFSLFFRPVSVEGPSMFSTLEDGERLLLSCFMYTPSRGDIVVIEREDKEPLIKRVIAIAGDTIRIDAESGRVYLNGEMLEEPYLDTQKTSPQSLTKETVVPNGHVFVMGDNRSNSHDSRAQDIGMIPQEKIVGKAVFRLLPFSRFGTL